MWEGRSLAEGRAVADGAERTLTRRNLIADSARLAAAGSVAGAVAGPLSIGVPAAVGQNGRTSVYLLGSQGGQQRTMLTGADIRGGPSALIVVDDVGYLIDAGVGALLRLNQAGFDANVVRHVFMTHHHQDHNADLGNLIGFSWTSGRQGSPDRRLGLWGPPGTNRYVRGYRLATTLNIRDQEGPLAQKPTLADFLQHQQFEIKGRLADSGRLIMTDARVSVRAIRVNHGSIPTVGYRFRTPDLDLVFSGDRGDRGDGLAEFAAGADVLFHEIIAREVVIAALEAEGAPQQFIDHQVHDHSAPDLVGQTATAAGVPKLVLYHLIPGHPAITDATWQAMVAPHYAGEIVVGHDLLEI